MIAVAIFFDGLQWILAWLFLDPLATFFAYMTFGLWFYLKGIKLLTPKRLATFGGTFILEVFPWIAALPAITFMVVITVLDTKIKQIASSAKPMGAITRKSGNESADNNRPLDKTA